MAYQYELSSVKRMPRYVGDTGTISGLCDEVARAKLDGKLDVSSFETLTANYITEINGTYPVVCTDNYDTTYEISMDTLPLVPGNGIEFVEQQDSHGYTSSVAIECTGGVGFPITGTDGTTNYTANANFSSFTLTTGQGAAGAHVNLNVKGVHFEAYPSTDVSASWYNIINAANSLNITCSSVKLTTAASENWFYTSAYPNLNEMTFIAPSYGPYETYSALIDDGDTVFCAEVDSGCCMKVVRNWNDDRNKNCWCGLPQESYFYIG